MPTPSPIRSRAGDRRRGRQQVLLVVAVEIGQQDADRIVEPRDSQRFLERHRADLVEHQFVNADAVGEAGGPEVRQVEDQRERCAFDRGKQLDELEVVVGHGEVVGLHEHHTILVDDPVVDGDARSGPPTPSTGRRRV